MMLWQVARGLTRRLPDWDGSSKLSLSIALPLLILLLGIGFFGPETVQLPARIGAFGLLITIQFLFLWANRRDASPYHEAQQHFVAGDYRAARDLLEELPERGRASVDALVLLGNSYRNLGDFSAARSALDRALALKPQHHLALFSAGKLQLVQGKYAAAVPFFERALEAGAPALIRLELGQAQLLLGNKDEALRQLSAARAALADDPAQLFLLQCYFHTLNAEDRPSRAFNREQIQFWQGESLKYAGAPYSSHLAELIDEFDSEAGEG